MKEVLSGKEQKKQWNKKRKEKRRKEKKSKQGKKKKLEITLSKNK